MTHPTFDDFTRSYIKCALWCSSENEAGDSFLDQDYDDSDISPECMSQMVKDCRDFQKDEAADLAEAGDDGQNGDDFWLTRNKHGVGYSDRGYGEAGDRLTESAHAYGNVDLYLGDDGLIYCS